MLEQLKYQNHLNEVIEFGKEGIYVDASDLRDYQWTATKKNERIAALNRKVSTRKLPIRIVCKSDAEGTAIRNKLFEVTEKDVLALQHGRIIIGDYYFKCFVTQSKKKDFLASKRLMQVDLTLTTDFPYWTKETVTAFSPQAGTFARNADFPFDYPYDYHTNILNRSLVNTGFASCNFRMVIFGPCYNPSISIAGHTYQVNCSVEESEYLTIDSVAKKIFLTENDGSVTNVFKLRNRESYIFEKIPPGSNEVAWDGSFGFNIILLEERSEPKWT